MNRIKKGDQVKVIAGKENGKQGAVLGFSKDGKRVLVEGISMVKRHTKPTQTSQGGIIEKESSIHMSNVMPLTPGGKPTRVQYKLDDAGKKRRYSAKHDEYLD